MATTQHDTEEMRQIEALKKRRTLDKNGKSIRWSEKLSPEAQLAMQLALEDTKAMKQAEEEEIKEKKSGNPKSPTRVAFADDNNTDAKDRPQSAKTTDAKDIDEETTVPKYTEIYERNGSARMRRDLTDETYSLESDPKKALGGGKVESAMEIVEIVNRDETTETTVLDEQAIDELARINSVDKCNVWIEATQAHQNDSVENVPEAELEAQQAES